MKQIINCKNIRNRKNRTPKFLQLASILLRNLDKIPFLTTGTHIEPASLRAYTSSLKIRSRTSGLFSPTPLTTLSQGFSSFLFLLQTLRESCSRIRNSVEAPLHLPSLLFSFNQCHDFHLQVSWGWIEEGLLSLNILLPSVNSQLLTLKASFCYQAFWVPIPCPRY